MLHCFWPGRQHPSFLLHRWQVMGETEGGGNQGKCVTKRGDLERVPDIPLGGTQRTCETSRKRQRTVLTIAGSRLYPRWSFLNWINFGAMCLPAESALRDPWAFYGPQNPSEPPKQPKWKQYAHHANATSNRRCLLPFLTCPPAESTSKPRL